RRHTRSDRDWSSDVCSSDLLDDALLDPAVEDGEAQLDAPEEIAPHPVGAGQIEIFLAAVEEIEDARVFEKPPYDRTHAYILGQRSEERRVGKESRTRRAAYA